MKKRLIEDCLAWNINDLTRAGVFRASAGTPCNCIWTDAGGQKVLCVNFWIEGNPETPALRMIERSGGSWWVPTPDWIELGFASCHIGGRKRLFRCPSTDLGAFCGQQAQKLYFVGGRWVCRKCGDLTYLTCRMHDKRKSALIRDPLMLARAL